MELLRRAVTRARRGDSLALVTVIEVSGSAPRHVGARMLVEPDGAIDQTVGGGRVELEVTHAAAEVAAGAPARLVKHHLTRDLAMCCGGSMTFFIEPVASNVAVIEDALARMDARRPVVLVTQLDEDADDFGRKSVRDWPDPQMDPEMGSQMEPQTGQASAGTQATESQVIDKQLFEPILPHPRMLLFGCGHVSRALGPMAAAIGFDVVICDDGETEALSSIVDAPWVKGTINSFDVRDVEADAGKLGVGDYALIMTRDHAIDQKILEQLIGNDELTYLGMIGSRGKVGRFYKRLSAKGLITDERWARLHAPIGLNIGSETPAEIAVSVVAQLVALRRGRPGR